MLAEAEEMAKNDPALAAKIAEAKASYAANKKQVLAKAAIRDAKLKKNLEAAVLIF